MRHLTLSLLLLSLAAALPAQTVPSTINYQGRLTDNSPTPAPITATVNMTFEIWDAPSAGARLWIEPASGATPIAVTGGIFNVLLGASAGGSSVPIPSTVFTTGTTARYLQIIANGETLTPRQTISATGYANQAQNAATAASATIATTATNATQLGGVAASGYLLTTGVAADSNQLGGSLASNWQKKLTTPACAGNLFLTTVNQDGTSACAASTGFTGSLAGDVTGTQAATVVGSVGGQSAANVAAGAVLANAATNLNTASAIVKRDASGNFTAGTITATLNGTSSALAADGGNCPTGQFSVGVDAAGNAQGCAEAVALAPPYSLTALDTVGNVGYFTSIAIGGDGLGLISYWDNTNGDLKVAHCANVACSSATLAALDAVGSVGYFTSITIGGDGLGLISYWDQTNGDLKVAHCANVACSSATLAALDTAGVVGQYTSITIGGDGLGLISYYDGTIGYLKVAHCSNAICTPYTRRR